MAIRVLHLNHTSTVSGAERSLLILMAAIPRTQSVGLVCPPGELAMRAREQGTAVFPLPELRVSLRISARHIPALMWRLIRAVLSVRRTARRTEATVLHANSTREALIAIGAHWLGGPPVVAHIRDVLPDSRLPLLINRLVRRRSQCVVATSNYVASRFGAANHLGAPITVVDNAVDLRQFPAEENVVRTVRAELGADRKTPLLGVVGQITSWKGHDTALRALALLEPRYADARLVIVGRIKFADAWTRLDNRAFFAFLEREVERLGLDGRVVFPGERDDIPAVLTALDVLLVPSVHEPFGRTVIEAMAAGTPVVATTVGGPAEIIDDRVTGFLAEPGQPAQWACAITKLLDDPIAAESISARARVAAMRRFDARLHARRMLEILESASARGRIPARPSEAKGLL